MITFEELRVTDDGKNLIIKVKVRDEAIYENVYIKSITVDTENTYGKTVSGKPVWEPEEDEELSEVEWILDKSDFAELQFNVRNHLYLVTVTVDGITNELPCGKDIIPVGVTYYKGNIYTGFMNGIREFGDTCQVPQGFIDALLKYEALNAAINTGHYTKAIDYFNRWFSGKYSPVITSNCGCNGRTSV